MGPFLADVTLCVERPDRRLPGRRPNEAWFYLDRVGPSRWLKVVVGHEGATKGASSPPSRGDPFHERHHRGHHLRSRVL
jgi:hypothetical protein